MAEFPILFQAAEAVLQGSSSRPDPESVVDALLGAEKISRKTRSSHPFTCFIGNWRLCFVTGTQNARRNAGVILGAGRYLPSLLRITLSYSPLSLPLPPAIDSSADSYEAGRVENQVSLAGFRVTLTGPAKLLPRRTVVAFDFTHLTLHLFGRKIITRAIRGGHEADQTFFQDSIKNQAFFVYFLVQDSIIAARGKGGGLALWARA